MRDPITTDRARRRTVGGSRRDVLPEGLIWISDDSEGKYDSKTGILTIGDFAIGERIVVNILTVINKTGKIINRANITANEYDFNLSNNNDEVVIVVNPACDVDIIKTVNNSLPNYDDKIGRAHV